MNRPMTTGAFNCIDQGAVKDYVFLKKLEQDYIGGLPDCILATLEELKNILSDHQINQLEHSLQAAARAERDGEDIELIVSALIHDITDALAPENHSQNSAAIIRPHIQAEVPWLLQKHVLFRIHNSEDKLGLQKDDRDICKKHEFFNAVVKFCQKWHQISFIGKYQIKELSYFELVVPKIFRGSPFDPKIIQQHS